MTLGTTSPAGRHGRASTVTKAEAVIAAAAARFACEALECRQLLATDTYVVPPGHFAAYIEAVPNLDGRVQVRLDSPTGDIDNTFENPSGQDIVDSGTNTPTGGFLFVDKVSAEDKPTTDGVHDGIKVQSASGGRLRLEAANADTLIDVAAGTVPVVYVTDNDDFI